MSFGKVKQLLGSTLSEAAAKLGVPRAHLVQCCKCAFWLFTHALALSSATVLYP